MPSTTNYSRGAVVLLPFPFSDQSAAKVRPAVVAHPPYVSDDLIVVAVSSERGTLRPGETGLAFWREAGLLHPSFLSQTVNRSTAERRNKTMRPEFRPRTEPGIKRLHPRHPARIALLFVAAVALSLSSLAAADIIVTSTADSGAGTLRAALASAASGDTIRFSLSRPATISLSSGGLSVTKSLTIVGPGPGDLAVDAMHADTAFDVSPASSIVTISGLTIANGVAPSYGGGINNSGATLTLSNCVVSGSSAYSGGGIYNDNGTLTVVDCTLSGNSATNGTGGGIYNDAGNGGNATVRLCNSTLTGNLAQSGSLGGGGGGGIYNNGFSGGTATNEISNCTFAGNVAQSFGGGIYNDGVGGTALLKIANSTFSSNSGGGIYLNGEISGDATLEIGNTLLDGGAVGGNVLSSSGTVISRGYNLSSDGAGGDGSTGPGGLLNATGDRRNTDPLLDPAGLKNNGGLTPTIALQSGSPAMDQGKRDTIPALATGTDQRGEPRAFDDPNVTNAADGDASDIGAYEASVRIVSANKLGGNLLLGFTTVLGRNYEAQSRSLAESGSWSPLPGNVAGNGGVVQSTVTNTFVQPRQFYRAHQLP